MFNTRLLHDEWKTFDEAKPEPETPYWFKMENGSIVLAVHINTNGSSGWAKASINEEGQVSVSASVFYMLKNATMQPAII